MTHLSSISLVFFLDGRLSRNRDSRWSATWPVLNTLPPVCRPHRDPKLFGITHCYFVFFFFKWLHHATQGIWVPSAGIEPTAPAAADFLNGACLSACLCRSATKGDAPRASPLSRDASEWFPPWCCSWIALLSRWIRHLGSCPPKSLRFSSILL